MASILHQTLIYLFPKNCFEELLIKLNVIHRKNSVEFPFFYRFLTLYLFSGMFQNRFESIPRTGNYIGIRAGKTTAISKNNQSQKRSRSFVLVAIPRTGCHQCYGRIRLHETFPIQVNPVPFLKNKYKRTARLSFIYKF